MTLPAERSLAADLFAGTRAEPREYQARICASVLSMLEGTWVDKDGSVLPAANSVLIDAPTGAGKTVMGLALAQRAAAQGARVGWAAMRRNLLSQAKRMIDEFGFQIPGIEFVSMFTSEPPAKLDWLFVDEAQHDATDSMARIHAASKPDVVVGLSATPYRSDRMKLAFQRTVREVGIASLIRDGYLSEYDHFTVPTHSPAAVADLFRLFPDRWGQSLVFFLTLEQCLDFARRLEWLRVPCEVVTANSDREAQLAAFVAGKVQVLVSMAILTEGFDCDSLQTVFVRPSGRGPTTQMAGRVLRRCAGVPVKQIVQCKRTRHPFVKTAPARVPYMLVEDSFRSLTPNKQIDEIASRFAMLAIQAQSGVPDFIVKNKSSRHRRGHGAPPFAAEE